MHTRSKKVLYGLITVILSSAQQAGAEEGFTINPYGAYLEGEAYFRSGFGPNSGIVLPEKGISALAFGFTLTKQFSDFSTNREANFVLKFHSSGENCHVELKPNFISVTRPFVGHIVGPGASDGLQAKRVSEYIPKPNQPNQPNQPQQYWFVVSAPDGSYLQYGDAINVGIYRSPQSPADTCTGDVVIQGIEVFYY